MPNLWHIALCTALVASAASGCRDGSKLNDDKLVLLALDGLDPQELDALIAADYLPTFQRVLAQGLRTDLHVDRYPMFSPVLWTTIATGYDETGHGVGNWLRQDGALYLAQDLGAERFWEVADAAGRPTLQLGYLLTTPPALEHGVSVSQTFGITAKNTNADPTQLVSPPERFDAFAAMIPDLPWIAQVPLVGPSLDQTGFSNYLGADEAYVRIFETVWEELHPEVSVLYLAGADKIGHALDSRSISGAQIAQSHGQTWAEAQRALVVRQYYTYLDTVLARVLQKLDPDTTTLVICSDHGWQLEGEREWNTRHRNPGLLIAWGKRARQGASPTTPVKQTDLGRTLFSLAHQAPAVDMPGRDLAELFALPTLTPIPSRLRDHPMRSTDTPAPLGPDQAAELRQLQAIGYVDEAGKVVPDHREPAPSH